MIPFVAIDVLNDASGREQLLARGVRNVPLLAKGDAHVFAQNLEDVAEFVGLQGSGEENLPPEELIGKWIMALRAGQRYVRQIPSERLEERATPNRDRTVRMVAHHVFRIGEAFLETAIDDVEYTVALIKNEAGYRPLVDGTFTTGEEIAVYAEEVIERLQRWWDALDDRSCQRKVRTYFGVQSLYVLYARSTWHSAHHSRQLMALLDRFGIEPNGRMSADDLAGLPLPERIWE